MNRQARRLYVGNIGWETSEQMICDYFNGKMREMGLVNHVLPGEEPCIGAQVNPEKGYAFVEFRSAEEATNAMAFDGIVYQNQSLKIRRPKDYIGPDLSAPVSVHVPGVVSTNVPDTPNKIFVGGLPTYLNDEQVMELLKAFGELRAFNLVREQNNGPSKGFAFCEYVDPSVTELACQGLNDMELGDRRLVVQRASMGNGRGNAGGTMLDAPARPLTAADVPGFVGGGGGAAGEPTRCMQMLNMVTPQELQDDEEYGEIVEDVREECAKFGEVLDVRIPRPEKDSIGLEGTLSHRLQNHRANNCRTRSEKVWAGSMSSTRKRSNAPQRFSRLPVDSSAVAWSSLPSWLMNSGQETRMAARMQRRRPRWLRDLPLKLPPLLPRLSTQRRQRMEFSRRKNCRPQKKRPKRSANKQEYMYSRRPYQKAASHPSCAKR